MVRRTADDNAPVDSGPVSVRPWQWVVLALGLAAVATVAVTGVYVEGVTTFRGGEAAAVEVSADRMIADYTADTAAAGQWYKARTVRLVGVVRRVRKMSFGGIEVQVGPADPQGAGRVVCVIDPADAKASPDLQAGDAVTILGRGRGEHGALPLLDHCTVEWHEAAR